MSVGFPIGSTSIPVLEAPRHISPSLATLYVIRVPGPTSPTLTRLQSRAAMLSPIPTSLAPASSPHSLFVSQEDEDLFTALPGLNEETERTPESAHESFIDGRTHPFAALLDESGAGLPHIRHATLFRGPGASPAPSVIRALSPISPLSEIGGPSSDVTPISESTASRPLEAINGNLPTYLRRDPAEEAPRAAPTPRPVVPSVPVQTAPVVPRHFRWCCY